MPEPADPMPLDEAIAVAVRMGESAAVALAAEVRRLHSWAGLTELLDEHYPPDVPLGPTADPGPRILALVREVDRLRAEQHEIQCPACGATIRARMSDAAGRARDEAAQAVVRDVQLISPSGWGALPAAVRESLDALVCAHGQAAAPADEPRPRVLTEQEGGPPNERYPDPPASERGCQAQIWPSWANWWVPCGSPVADGKCQVYGHPAPAEPVETEEAGR